MILTLVRHGETDLHLAGRTQGNNGAPLNATGRSQARAAAQALKLDLPFAMYTSPVRRAIETARIASEVLHVPVTTLDALKELEVGELDGLTDDEIRHRYPEYLRDWTEDPATARPPGGESLGELQDRAWQVVSDLLEEPPSDTVVAVTHGYVIRTIVCRVLGLPLARSVKLHRDIGSITRLELSSDGGALVSLNETGHLRSLSGADYDAGA